MGAAVRVLAAGDLSRYSSRGPSRTARLERELANWFGAEYALAVNSGTSALICALVGAGIGPGDEVLVPAYTWVSTAAAALAVGAVPVVVEVDESLTMDPTDLADRLTPNSRAVIPVHMINLVCDMDAIMTVAEDRQLVVIEDACQAIGVRYRGRPVGSIGHIGTFSFNQNKNIKSGEGGAVLTNDRRIFERASMYHDVGSYERDDFASEEPLFVGVNLRMPELCAAVLRPQLRRLEALIDKLRTHREVVVEALAASEYSYRLSPHHDPDHAVGLAITFDDPDEASRFGQNRGARRLLDTGRHVYTNWQSIAARRTAHAALDPYAWATRPIDFDEHSCPRTLDILARTCTVDLAPEIPTPAFRLLAKRMVR
jgi:dTDP-4-amino-4,6-dideoxygalactose transaminase